jgi:hypothetical protein
MSQWKNPLLSIFHFRYWPKTLKNEVLKRNPQIILGFFDPDPVLLAKQWAEQRIKKSQNDLRIKLQNFVFYNLDQ